MNLIDCSDIDTQHPTDYGEVWDALQSHVYHVVDEQGCNVAGAMVRHLIGDYYLYVDNLDGYEVMTDAELSSLSLVAEKPDEPET